MSCENFNLACSSEGSFAIYQGTTYNCLTLFYQDIDVSSYTPLGQIRDDYVENGGNILATFQFEPLVFGSVDVDGVSMDATVIIPFLSASQTAAIQSTLPRANESQGFFAGVTGWVYDIKLIGANETILITSGFVEVLRCASRV